MLGSISIIQVIDCPIEIQQTDCEVLKTDSISFAQQIINLSKNLAQLTLSAEREYDLV